MPPSDEYQPDVTLRSAWVEWIQSDVFRLDTTRVDPGKVVLRRLNRAEYGETVKQLTDVDVEVDELFPADDTGYGFDTIGEVLHISPVLLEKYLAAAESIVEDAIPTGGPSWPEQRFYGDHFRMDSVDGPQARGVRFTDDHSFHLEKKFQRPGTYQVSVRWKLDGAWTNTDQEGEVTLFLHDADGSSPKEIAKQRVGFNYQTGGTLSGLAQVGHQPLHLSVLFHPTGKDTTSKQADNASAAPYDFRIEFAHFVGPTDGDFKEYKSGERILFNNAPPKDAGADTLDAMTEEVLRRFATRAFRRPIDEPTLARLCGIARDTRGEDGKGYEHGIASAVKLILASPRFLFRVEEPLAGERLSNVPADLPTSPLGVPIDDLSLATRMSYFLWGGPPDEELMAIAEKGELREKLEEQIDRMIGEEWRLRVGVENFVGQWLKTRDVQHVAIDVKHVLAYRQDEKVFQWPVRQAMKDETLTMFRYLIEQNRPIEELLNADYTFLNEDLAEFYGIDGVKGKEMQKVDLPADSHRRGILTHGSVLLVTSNPTRTSPVKRGLFILENLLGTPAPPAPPNVPSLEESKSGDMKDASLRQILEQHRKDPACASCHQRMDPLGLALENYNAIGQYRDMELGLPGWRDREAEPDKAIDPKGVLMTGEKFESVIELADILANERRDDFYRCLTEKMLIYALGRGLTYSDATTVDRIVAEVKADGGKMKTLIGAVVRSVPFTHALKPDSVAAVTP